MQTNEKYYVHVSVPALRANASTGRSCPVWIIRMVSDPDRMLLCSHVDWTGPTTTVESPVNLPDRAVVELGEGCDIWVRLLGQEHRMRPHVAFTLATHNPRVLEAARHCPEGAPLVSIPGHPS